MLNITDAFLFIVPAYIANMMPLILGGGRPIIGKIIGVGRPIDFNRKFLDGRPILGKGKTFRGVLVGVVSGTCMVFLVKPITADAASFPLASQLTITLAFLLSLGTVLGDIIASFIKRRLNIVRGASMPVFDQLDFLVVALLFASFMVSIPLSYIIFLLLLTPVVHLVMNWVGYKLKFQSVSH